MIFMLIINSFINFIQEGVTKLVFTPIAGIPLLLWYISIVLIFLMVKLRFINIWGIGKMLGALKEINHSHRKLYDNEVSPLTALGIQLAGNLGIGNIAGAGFALYLGGPGTIFWVVIWGIFLSIIKFSEIVLGHKFRIFDVKSDTVKGGLFVVVRHVLKEKHSKIATITSSILAILTALVLFGFAAVQVNQMSQQITASFVSHENYTFSDSYQMVNLSIIVVCMIFVWLVLIGGIKRIGKFCNSMVPFMAVTYIVMCLAVIIYYALHTPPGYLFETLIKNPYRLAFSFEGGAGGMILIAIVSFQRMLFATDSFIGTAAIIHASSNVKAATQQAILALLDSFIISLILVLGMMAVLANPQLNYNDKNLAGILMIKQTFAEVNPILPYLITIICFFFAITTVLSHGYSILIIIQFIFHKIKTHTVFCFYVLITGLMAALHSSPLTLIKMADLFSLLILFPNGILLITLVSYIKADIKLYFQKDTNSLFPAK